jgi:5-methylthioadenosine/S-adenosylhomocysteine deaminase
MRARATLVCLLAWHTMCAGAFLAPTLPGRVKASCSGVPRDCAAMQAPSSSPSLRRDWRKRPATGRPVGLRMGGYEVSSATSMGTQYTFLAAKCYVEGTVRPAEVKVENEKIVKVQVLSESEYAEAAKSAPPYVLQLGEEILLFPALVNAHTHLAMGALRGITDGDAFTGNVVEDLFFRLEVNLEPEDVRAFVRMGCWEAMLAGTGCVWEHYYFGEAIADAFMDTGITGTIAPTLQDLSGPGLSLAGCGWEDTLHTTMAIHCNETLRSKGIVAALGPHATDTVSPRLWQAVAEAAAGWGLPIHAHVSQSIEEFERIRERHGKSPVELLKDAGVLDSGASMLMVHSMFLSKSDLALLQPGKHVLGLCPASAVQFGFPCNYAGWREAGLTVALGTDAACSNDNMDVQGELRLLAGGGVFGVWSSAQHSEFFGDGSDAAAAAVQAKRQELLAAGSDWNKPSELLRCVTTVPGALHQGLAVGSIREGALANLLFVRLDHPNMWPRFVTFLGVGG